MRGKIKKINRITPDRIYNSVNLSKFINSIMTAGEKSVAQRVVYKAFEVIKEKIKNPNPLEIFDLALKNVSPSMEVRSRRIGGANYQVPREIRPERQLALAMTWIIKAARSKKGLAIHLRLANELISASKKEGDAFKKMEDTHRMAEANKAFAHFSWGN